MLLASSFWHIFIDLNRCELTVLGYKSFTSRRRYYISSLRFRQVIQDIFRDAQNEETENVLREFYLLICTHAKKVPLKDRLNQCRVATVRKYLYTLSIQAPTNQPTI